MIETAERGAPSQPTVAAPGEPGPGRPRRRVLLVTYEFPPSVLMGAQACAQIVRHLPRYGWEAIVLTVRERYCEYTEPPVPVAYDGLIVRTGVMPHPLALYRLSKGLLPGRPTGDGARDAASDEPARVRRWMLSVLRVPDEHTGWIVPASVAGAGIVRRLGVRQLLSSGPSWTNHLVGLVLARATGRPWTAHFRDPWTQVPGWKVVSPLSARMERALERMVVRRADSVVCVTDAHAAELRRTYSDVPADRFVTIPNGYDGAEWEGIAGDAGGGRECFVVTFAGNLYNTLTPLPLFRALRALLDSGEVERGRIRIDLVGWCEWARGRRLADLAEECGVADAVTVRGPVDRAAMLRTYLASDLLLVLADGLPLQIPGKTYEYLRAGRPILALTSAGALADLLRRTRGGWVVDPADAAGVTQALREAYRCWRDGGACPQADPRLVQAFDRRVLAGQFADLFETAAGRARRAEATT